MGSSGVWVDRSREGDFCLAGAGAVLAFRGGTIALCLHQSVLTSVRGGSPWQVVVFGGAGTLLRAQGRAQAEEDCRGRILN